jgi:hypothetical protein
MANLHFSPGENPRSFTTASPRILARRGCEVFCNGVADPPLRLAPIARGPFAEVRRALWSLTDQRGCRICPLREPPRAFTKNVHFLYTAAECSATFDFFLCPRGWNFLNDQNRVGLDLGEVLQRHSLKE